MTVDLGGSHEERDWHALAYEAYLAVAESACQNCAHADDLPRV